MDRNEELKNGVKACLPLVLTAVLLVCIVSAIVNAVTFPEHGLTQFVFAMDRIWFALWKGNTLKRIQCDYDAGMRLKVAVYIQQLNRTYCSLIHHSSLHSHSSHHT